MTTYNEAVVTFRLKLKEGAATSRGLIEELTTYVNDAVLTEQGGLRPPGALGVDDPGDFMFSNVEEISHLHVANLTPRLRNKLWKVPK